MVPQFPQSGAVLLPGRVLGWPCPRHGCEAKQHRFGYTAELLWQQEGLGTTRLSGLDREREMLGHAGPWC